MYISTKYLHVFLDIGDALLSSGAEIFRVEDTLNRMGYACGATQMNEPSGVPEVKMRKIRRKPFSP